MLKRTIPEWGAPYESNGNWHTHVSNLYYRDLDALYKHDVARGNPIFPHPQTGKAHITLRNFIIVDEADAHRAWWWLREDIGVESFTEHYNIARAMNDALLNAPRYAEPDEDDLSPFGEII